MAAARPEGPTARCGRRQAVERSLSERGGSVAIVADDNAVYWGDQTGNAVLKYDLTAGQTITLAMGQTGVHDLALDPHGPLLGSTPAPARARVRS